MVVIGRVSGYSLLSYDKVSWLTREQTPQKPTKEKVAIRSKTEVLEGKYV